MTSTIEPAKIKTVQERSCSSSSKAALQQPQHQENQQQVAATDEQPRPDGNNINPNRRNYAASLLAALFNIAGLHARTIQNPKVINFIFFTFLYATQISILYIFGDRTI